MTDRSSPREADRIAAAAVLSVLAVFALVALAGCADDAPTSSSYSYDPGDAAVDVNTAELRAQKAAGGHPGLPEGGGTTRRLSTVACPASRCPASAVAATSTWRASAVSRPC